MAKKLTKDEAEKLIQSSKRTAKDILFGDQINDLKKGESLFISDKEWTMKTTMTAYYYQRFGKGIEKADRAISYNRVKDGFLITKLK
jgi:hypothetical protein